MLILGEPVSFSFDIKPVQWQRPGVVMRGRYPHLYTKEETATFEAEIARLARIQHRALYSGRYDKERVAVEMVLGCSDRRGDVDNFAKAILDGLVKAELVMRDDSLVDLLLVRRHQVPKGEEFVRVQSAHIDEMPSPSTYLLVKEAT